MLGNILLIAAGIVLVFLIFRFVAQTIWRLLLLLLIIGGVGYAVWNWQEQKLPGNNEAMLIYQLEEEHCGKDKKEAVCDCIIQPVIDELEDRYSKKEIKEMQQKDLKAMRAMLGILKDNRREMKSCLKDCGALDQWEQFKQDLKDQNLPEKLDKLFQ